MEEEQVKEEFAEAPKNKNLRWWEGKCAGLCWPLGLFLWLEVVFRLAVMEEFSAAGVGYTLLFTLAYGLIWGGVMAVGSAGFRRVVGMALSIGMGIWFTAQTIYYTIFSTLMTLYSVGNGADALQFWRDGLKAAGEKWYALALIWAAVIFLCVRSRKSRTEEKAGPKAMVILMAVGLVLELGTVGCVLVNDAEAVSPRYLYRYSFIPEKTAREFGVLTTLRLDAKQLLFGVEEIPLEPVETLSPSPTPVPAESEEPTMEEPVVYEANVMDIDFEALAESTDSETLKNMDAWFGSREATMQNEYTGAWKGKNLIFIVAEGFSTYAMTEETTPTLWKLSHEGFVAENYYLPLWWVSTSDGEYVADTSLIPKSGVWSFYRSSENHMKFCLGNQLRAEGYATRAYHDHTYTYYKRHLSHPNMGYDYKGLGSGLEVKQVWPESDVEMMEKTIDEYIGDTPFHTYYMTVSGHMNYNFMGNMMAYKHKDEVGHEDMSEEARAYLACQMELDQALEYLLSRLEEAGILEDTAIVLTGDHYPYGAEKATVNELVGHEVEETFETYHSTLILWSGDMADKEPVVIEKPICSLDILPTVSNLMGLEYDSRLLMGHDALSDHEGLVVLSDRSFITGLGRYDSGKNEFTPNEGATVPEGYVEEKSREVGRMFAYSAKVLEEDYYRHVFPNDGES